MITSRVFSLMALAAVVSIGCTAPKSDGAAKHDSALQQQTASSTQPSSQPAASSSTPSQPGGAPTAMMISKVTKVEGKLGADNVAPNFTWMGADGKEHSLSEYRGKVVMLNFWGTWCPPCRAELPDIVKLRNELGPKGFEVIGLGVGEQPRGGKTIEQNVAEFAQKNGLNYPLLLVDEDMIEAYGGLTGVPTTFIVDTKGVIIEKMVGMRDGATFRESVQKAM